MNENKLYLKTRRWFYNQFDKLKVSEDTDRIVLRDKHEFSVIRIYKLEKEAFYFVFFRYDLVSIIPIKNVDFEMFLIEWIEEKFKIKLTKMHVKI